MWRKSKNASKSSGTNTHRHTHICVKIAAKHFHFFFSSDVATWLPRLIIINVSSMMPYISFQLCDFRLARSFFLHSLLLLGRESVYMWNSHCERSFSVNCSCWTEFYQEWFFFFSSLFVVWHRQWEKLFFFFRKEMITLVFFFFPTVDIETFAGTNSQFKLFQPCNVNGWQVLHCTHI